MSERPELKSFFEKLYRYGTIAVITNLAYIKNAFGLWHYRFLRKILNALKHFMVCL
ncbi:MAG: hypothetical protein QW837_06330 [Conexivisphaerales archaeon]